MCYGWIKGDCSCVKCLQQLGGIIFKDVKCFLTLQKYENLEIVFKISLYKISGCESYVICFDHK